MQEFGLPFVSGSGRSQASRATSCGVIGPRWPRIMPGRGTEADRIGRSPRTPRRDPVQRRGPHTRERAPADCRGDHLVVRRRSGARVHASRPHEHLARPGGGPGGGLLRGGPARRRHSHRRRYGTLFLRRTRDDGSRETVALRGSARCSQEGEEIAIAGHDFDLLMGQAGGVPAGEQRRSGPTTSQGALGQGRPGLDPRASSVAKPDARESQGEGRVGAAGQPGGAGHRGRHDRVVVPIAHGTSRRWRLQIQLRGPAGQLEPAGGSGDRG